MSHGAWFGQILVAVAAMSVGASIFYCAKFLLHPGEDAPDHIKRGILVLGTPPSTPDRAHTETGA